MLAGQMGILMMEGCANREFSLSSGGMTKEGSKILQVGRIVLR